MNLQDSAMDDMNRQATDVLECEKCSSENLELLDAEHDEKTDSVTFTFECKDCKHTFSICE